ITRAAKYLVVTPRPVFAVVVPETIPLQGVITGATGDSVIAEVAKQVYADVACAEVVVESAADRCVDVGKDDRATSAATPAREASTREVDHYRAGGTLEVEAVVAGPAIDGIVAVVSAEKEIIPSATAEQRIVPFPAVHHGKQGGLVGDDVVQRVAIHFRPNDVRVPCATQREIFDTVIHQAKPRADHVVDAAGVEDHVIIELTIDEVGVVAGTAIQRVVALNAVQGVISGQSLDRVVADRADQTVIAARADNMRAGVAAVDHANVGGGKSRCALERGDELGGAGPVA